MRNSIGLLVASVLVAACDTSAPGDEPVVGEPTADAVFEHVLKPSCAFGGCHSESKHAANLALTREQMCNALVSTSSCLFPNKKLVVPSNPDDSFLMAKLTGQNLTSMGLNTDCPESTNEPMPFGLNPLSEQDLTLVRSWIAAGAPCEGGPTPSGAPLVSNLSVDRAAPVAGETIKFTVTLNKPAPEGGQLVELSTATTALSAPVQVFVPARQSSTTFDAYAERPTSQFTLLARTGATSKEIRLRIAGLDVAEVMSEVAGGDDRMQWVKLRNRTGVRVELSGYRLRVGQSDYGFSTVPLSGSVEPGACVVIGGPASSAANGYPTFTQSVNFVPDLPHTGPQATGYAVFDDTAPAIGGIAFPMDTMLVGASNASQLLGPDGPLTTPYCGTTGLGLSAKRTADGQCVASLPTPNQCP